MISCIVYKLTCQNYGVRTITGCGGKHKKEEENSQYEIGFSKVYRCDLFYVGNKGKI